MKTEQKTVITKWQPSQWEYPSEATNIPLSITEGTAADCFEFEQKASAISVDAAADWLISKYVMAKDDKSINLVTAAEFGLNFADKMAALQIIKMQDGLSVEPLDNRDKATTKHFRINNKEFIEGLTFRCEDPPFNHRASDCADIPAALIELAKNNIIIEWLAYGVEPITIGQSQLDSLPYFVGDVGIRHFSQMLSRIPKKKRLQKRSDG
jgi:hypothetical protein